jgi:hypothetical protein
MRLAARRQWALILVGGLLALVGSGFVHPGTARSLRQIPLGMAAGMSDASATLADTLLPGTSRLDSAGPADRGGLKSRAHGWALPVGVVVALSLASGHLIRQPACQPVVGFRRTGARRRAPPILPIP